MNQADSTQMTAMRDFLARRQDEILGLICKLVETESPSGDCEGSRAVVDLLVEAAGTISAINSVERLPVPGYGEHIRINAVAPLAATRLAQGVFPEEMASRLKPELVTPVVAYLCSEQCEASGDIISAGAGSYSAVKIVESKGVRFGTEQEMTPEMIAAKYRDITKMEGATSFDDAQEQFASLLTGGRSIID